MRYLLLMVVITLAACSPKTSFSESVENMSRSKSIQVLDTDFSKGRLSREQNLSLWDLQKLHGHLCDGLAVGFLALEQAFKKLYPGGLIDRTNTRVVAQTSPCIGDAAMFLTGGRYQFNTFYVDHAIEGLYIVQRLDSGKAVAVKMKPGIKNQRIDSLGNLAVKGLLGVCELDELRKLEDDFTKFLLADMNPEELFEVIELPSFQWQPLLKNDLVKTDVLNKDMGTCRRE